MKLSRYSIQLKLSSKKYLDIYLILALNQYLKKESTKSVSHIVNELIQDRELFPRKLYPLLLPELHLREALSVKDMSFSITIVEPTSIDFLHKIKKNIYITEFCKLLLLQFFYSDDDKMDNLLVHPKKSSSTSRLDNFLKD